MPWQHQALQSIHCSSRGMTNSYLGLAAVLGERILSGYISG